VEQRTKVAADSKLGHSRMQILQALWMANPDCYLMTCEIYNLLYCFQMEELARDTPIEWLSHIDEECNEATTRTNLFYL
jgi:hypothetical protein